MPPVTTPGYENGGGGQVSAVVAGTLIDVDPSDPANPVISVEGQVLTQSEADGLYAPLGGVGIIAYKAHTPGSNYSTTSSSFSDVDATNVAVTFTVPSSGRVLVEAHASVQVPDNGNTMDWSLRESTTDVISRRISNLALSNTSGLGGGAPNIQFPVLCRFAVTGLTAAASKTYKLGWKVSGSTGYILSGAQVTLVVSALP